MTAALRRHAAASGPWPAARVLRAAAAGGVAACLAAWTVTADPRAGGLLAVPALAGLAALAVAVVTGRLPFLGSALGLLGVAAAVALVSVDAAALTAAGVGAALVAVLELARWSVERRVNPPVEGATERRRWRHLAAVLAGGWLAGAGVVAVAAGRLQLVAWQAALGGLAAVAVAGAIAVAARRRGARPGERRGPQVRCR